MISATEFQSTASLLGHRVTTSQRIISCPISCPLRRRSDAHRINRFTPSLSSRELKLIKRPIRLPLNRRYVSN
jgi:hypothetical protein